jgi:hypothetical protein
MPGPYHTDSSLLARAGSKACMFRAWRRVALVALAAGAALAVQLAVIAPAQAAGPVISIAATSKIKPVTGYVLVEYRGGPYASARIHGTITGAAAGEIVILYAQRFPYTKAAAPVRSVTLSAAGPAAYSFTVTPALATRYKVKLFARKTATTPLATSRTHSVYVTVGGSATGGRPCGRPVCRETLHQFVILPGSALRLEMSKPFYPYFGLRLGSAGAPALPKWLYLSAGHASVGRAQRISAVEFERTITFSFTIGNHPYNWAWLVCLKDTVSRDGLGVPGHHGCGSSPVLRTVAYLG